MFHRNLFMKSCGVSIAALLYLTGAVASAELSPLYGYQTSSTNDHFNHALVDVEGQTQEPGTGGSRDMTDPFFDPMCAPPTDPMFDPMCSAPTDPMIDPMCSSTDPMMDPNCGGGFPTDPNFDPSCVTDPVHDPFCSTPTDPGFDPMCSTDPMFDPMCMIPTDPNMDPNCVTDPMFDPMCFFPTDPAFDVTCMTDPMYDASCQTVDALERPATYGLQSAAPNPFNPTTTIRFSLDEARMVDLSVYDMGGRHITTLANGVTERGTHAVVFDATGMSSGVYFAVLRSELGTQTSKLVLLK